ncbi:MAG: DEAD/DEAH box helicase [Candidatus Sericytochromatia bacterium]|nr:DEAD/DEAH box helicase [Candidatus Tanganyikabacteria bacterium]
MASMLAWAIMGHDKRPEFKSFHLKYELLEGLADMGYSQPTPVQALAIPEVIAGHDLLVQAKTGSGKTLAFGLGLLNRLDLQRVGTQCLVITPTRELALQVASEIARVGRHLGVLIEAVFGGVPIKEHITAAQWSTFLVGTPGRLRDLLERGHLRLDTVRAVVLDEADEMLDMGFKKDLEFILDAGGGRQQTLLFSATFPREIIRIAKTYMRDARKIQAQPEEATPTTISHRAVRTTHEHRFETLVDVLKAEKPDSALIFCQTKTETPWLARRLRSAGFKSGCLHGDMSQTERFDALEAFKRGDVQIMVATEVAARGLDIANVSHVINYSVPSNPEIYVHRSGRTGRAGRSGIAITLVTPKDERQYARIEKLVAASAAPVRPRSAAPPAEPRSAGRVPEERAPAPAPAHPRRRGPDPHDFIDYAGHRLDDFLPMARHLLHIGDPVTLVAALLASHPLAEASPEESVSAAPPQRPRRRRR